MGTKSQRSAGPTQTGGAASLLRNDRATADVVVVVAGVEYHCHRCILAVSSEVFRTMLYTAGMREQTRGRVELDGVSETAWLALYRYCYDGIVRWTDLWRARCTHPCCSYSRHTN